MNLDMTLTLIFANLKRNSIENQFENEKNAQISLLLIYHAKMWYDIITIIVNYIEYKKNT